MLKKSEEKYVILTQLAAAKRGQKVLFYIKFQIYLNFSKSIIITRNSKPYPGSKLYLAIFQKVNTYLLRIIFTKLRGKL